MFERFKTCSGRPASGGTTRSKICLRLISTSQTAAHIKNPWERAGELPAGHKKKWVQHRVINSSSATTSESLTAPELIPLTSFYDFNYGMGNRSSSILYIHCQRVTMGFTLSVTHCEYFKMFVRVFKQLLAETKSTKHHSKHWWKLHAFWLCKNHQSRYYRLPLGSFLHIEQKYFEVQRSYLVEVI